MEGKKIAKEIEAKYTTKERNNKNRSFFCVLMFFSH